MHERPVPTRETVGIRGEECKARRVRDFDLKILNVGEVAEPGNGLKAHICLSRLDCEDVIAGAGQEGPVTATLVDSSSVAAR